MSVTQIPLVSIIIPTYNHAHFLGRALQSILDQTYTNWEVVVVDNHSLDNTDEVVQGFSDSRINLLKIHNNGVIAASRNMGIKIANGKWIAFLDSDDWWKSAKLERSVATLEAGADLVYHNLFTVRSIRQTSFNEKIISTAPNHPMFAALLCTGMSVPNSSVVVRKSLLNRIGEISENCDLISVEDYDTWIRLSRLTEKFVRIPECLGYYWRGGGNMSAASPKQIARIKVLYSQYIDDLPVKYRAKAEGFLAYRIGRIAQQHGNSETAIDNLKTALRSPIDFSFRLKAAYWLTRGLASKTNS